MVEAKGKKNNNKKRALQFLGFLTTIVDKNDGNPPPDPPKKTSAQNTREIWGKNTNKATKLLEQTEMKSYLPQ